SLPVTGRVQFVITGTLPSNATDPIVNSAFVTPLGVVVDPNPDSASAVITVTSSVQADLSIVKAANTTYVPGETFAYSITVRNAGPGDATNVQIRDALPTALQSFRWTCTPDARSVCSIPNGQGDINLLADIPAGGSIIFPLSGTVASDTVGTLTNAATVTP